MFIPFSREVANGFGIAADIGVALVFLLYGMRLPTREVLSGLANIRLQGSILLATFAIFPLVGLGSCDACVSPTRSGTCSRDFLPVIIAVYGSIFGDICVYRER
nr:bile acid:sodium symporter [Arcanobacterium phocae]